MSTIAGEVQREMKHLKSGTLFPSFGWLISLWSLSGLVVSCSSGGGGGVAVNSYGAMATWAGEGTQGFDGGGQDRTTSTFNSPMEMNFGPDGRAYIVDWNNHRIRRVEADGTIETVIGLSLPGDWPCQDPDNPANCDVPLDGTVEGEILGLNHPMDIVFRADGTAVIAAWHNHKVEEFDPSTGMVTILAGQMVPGFSGDGGSGIEANMNFPDSIVIDAAGHVLVSDERSNRVRRITVDGGGSTITTVVGSSLPATVSGYEGDGGPAVPAILALTPYDEAGGSDNPPAGGGLAMDGEGNLYIADTFNHCIRKVVPGADGLIGEGDPAEEIITTLAGTCGKGDGGFSKTALASHSIFNQPHDLDFGPDGRLYVTDTNNHAIRAIDVNTGKVETVAGTVGVAGFSGDGASATLARLNKPYGIAFDDEGNLYIVDRDNNRIRVVRVDGSTVTTAPAVSVMASPTSGSAPLTVNLTATASDPDGGAIVKYEWDFNSDGIFDETTTSSSTSTVLDEDGNRTIRVRVTDTEGQSAKASVMVTVSESGMAECPDATGEVIPVGAPGTIITVAGTGTDATDPVDGDQNGLVDCAIPVNEAGFSAPMDMTLGPDGRLYIADWNGHKIRALGGNGMVAFVAGTGIEGDACDVSLNPDGSCPASFGQLNHMTDVVFDTAGRMVVAAWHNSKVKRVDLDENSMVDICGDGGRSFKGDGGPCRDASTGNDLVSFDLVTSVIYDAFGNLFVSDQANQVIRRIGADGVVSTVAGNCPVQATFGCFEGQGFDGDGGPATQAHIKNNLGQGTDPQGKITLDVAGNLYIADSGNSVIRKVVPGGDGVIGSGDPNEEIITTVAGTGVSGFSGDGGLATTALLNQPRDVAVDVDGTIYIADTGNNCVRKVDGSGVISTVAGRCGEPGDFAGEGGPAFLAALNQPYGVELDGDGNLYIADTLNHRIRVVIK